LPKEILDRAKDILAHLEQPNGTSAPDKRRPAKRARATMPTAQKPQMDLL